MTKCLTDEQLDRLAEGELPASEAGMLKEHIDQCAKCRRLYEECRKNLVFSETVRETVTEGTTLVAGESMKALLREPTIPQVDEIRGYRILNEIHRGAQGVVCRGESEHTGEIVAIKFLREGPYASDASLKRFEREIELVQSLQHPNIIRVLESGVSKIGHQYFVMEFVDGMPLHRYVWSKKLALEDALELFVRVCHAVNHAHQKGVLHRDLKPSNVLVDRHGVPHVLDFGLAKDTLDDAVTLVSMTGQVVGTLPYMSPEQARGNHDQVDIRTDVYALGVMLYRLLTGQYPYPVTGALPDILKNITETPPTPPSQAWTGKSGVINRSRTARAGEAGCPIDEDVETILLRTLAKDPTRRYPNVDALTEDLQRYLNGQPIAAKRDAGLNVLSRSLKRYRLALIGAAFGILLTTAFAIVVMILWEQTMEEKEVANISVRWALNMQEQLADLQLTTGNRLLREGKLAEARGAYESALTQNRHLASQQTLDRHYHWNIAEIHLRFGDIAMLHAEYVTALDAYRRFHSTIDQMTQAVPGHDEYRSRLALSHERLARVHDHLGEREQALAQIAIARVIRRDLADDANSSAAHIRGYAWSLLATYPESTRDPVEALRQALIALNASRREAEAEMIKRTIALAYERSEGLPDAAPLRSKARQLFSEEARTLEQWAVEAREREERELYEPVGMKGAAKGGSHEG